MFDVPLSSQSTKGQYKILYSVLTTSYFQSSTAPLRKKKVNVIFIISNLNPELIHTLSFNISLKQSIKVLSF